MRNETFLVYRSGILAAEAVFSEEGIRQARRSIVTGEAEAWEDVSEAAFPAPAVYRLWKSEAWTTPWTGDVLRGLSSHHVRSSAVRGSRGAVYAQLETSEPVDVIVQDGRPVAAIVSGRNESLLVVKDGFQREAGLEAWYEGPISPLYPALEELGIFMVPMADGTRLATDVALPSPRGSESLPAILIRTCYGRRENRDLWLKYARRGYAVVIQDVRGRDDSEGEWLPFANERGDGSDTLDWIARQPWSNGAVGMLGGSYLGFVQWAAAASGNPRLKAIVSQVTAGSPFVDLPRRGGAFGSGILAWSFMVADRRSDPSAMARDDWAGLLTHRPIREIPEHGLGRSIPFFDQWMAHEHEDAFWQRSDWSLHDHRIDVPALCVSGWYDDDGPGTFQAWAMNQRNGRAHQRMIVGPWLHKANGSRRIHGLDLPAHALVHNLDLHYLRWFDHFLKGMDNGIDREAAVDYYMTGSGAWRTAPAWPPPAAAPQDFYLQSGISARSSRGDGALSQERPSRVGSSDYVSRPADPFPYLIDVSENECAVPADYREVESREDVLVYTSGPLAKELAIAGSPVAKIFASSSGLDTDWIVRLCDLGPDGRSIKLSDGLIRARYRRSFREPVLLEPGKVEAYVIPMTNVAHLFRQGHRIRIHVTSGADKLCFPNSQTGGRESEATVLVDASQRIHEGGLHASHVTLPVLG